MNIDYTPVLIAAQRYAVLRKLVDGYHSVYAHLDDDSRSEYFTLIRQREEALAVLVQIALDYEVPQA